MFPFATSNLNKKDAASLLLSLFQMRLDMHVQFGVSPSIQFSEDTVVRWLAACDRKASFMFRAKAAAVAEALFIRYMNNHSEHSLPLERLNAVLAQFLDEPTHPHGIVVDSLIRLAEAIALESRLIKG